MVGKYGAALILAAASTLAWAPVAHAVSYSTSGFSLGGLGDTMNSGYDYLTGTSEGGPLSDPGTILLNSVSFTAGVNATAPQNYPNQYSIVETLTIGSNSQQITIPFSLDISYSDTVTIAGGTTFSFLDGGSLWQVVLNALTLGPNPGGTISGLLTAQVSDPVPQTPLPAALPLFASGLGGMSLFAWWRRRRNGAATSA